MSRIDPLRSIFLAFQMVVLYVMLDAVLRLAYSHSALCDLGIKAGVFLHNLVSWPILLWSHLSNNPTASYAHSHAQGSDFWTLMFEFIAGNSLGWSVLIYGLFLLADKLHFNKQASPSDS